MPKPKQDEYLDISVPLRGGMAHWPGDPAVRIRPLARIGRGVECNLTALSMCVHAGTHMDAPLHYLAKGVSIDRMPVEATVGRARVIEIAHPVAIEPKELRHHRIRRGERLLFRTRNSERQWTDSNHFFGDYVHISPDGARFLADRGVRTVGVDYLSVGSPGPDGADTHRILLRAGIWIIEGLDLSKVTAGAYELICLPLRIPGADGAPARALLRWVKG